MATRRRRWVLGILLGLLGLVVVGVVAAYWYARPLLLTGTGYAAHNACALAELSGRSDPATDLPPNPLVPYLRTSTGEDGSVTASVLGMLARQTATPVEGFGCTITDPADLPARSPIDPAANTLVAQPDRMDAGLQEAMARAFGEDLEADETAALGTRAVVVLSGGHVVGERYADGFDDQTRQLGWSMAKSVANMLTGRLVEEGVVSLADTGLRPGWTDDRADISIEDLLRMRSGLAWDETYDLGTPITEMLYLEGDMAGFAASQPLGHPIGQYQQYSSGSTNILCSVLLDRAEADAAITDDLLFAPLGLTSPVWETDETGLPVCGSYLWATPRDWAALGQLALDDGVWGGERLLPDGWMQASTTAVTPAESDADAYGMSWWLNARADGSLRFPQLPSDAYWMSGHDGQRVYVVPSADVVVVRMGFSPGVAAEDLRANELVAEVVDILAR
ncbi:MAG: serine hydrolase domain-containing protein [Dermatophilaceae bacterium]|nr:beta-lactamase family protein [Intrasporangiaceae bacterium]